LPFAPVQLSAEEFRKPRAIAGTLQPVSAISDTEITFPPEVLARHPELEGVRITVPANALFADNGTHGGRVGIGSFMTLQPSPLPRLDLVRAAGVDIAPDAGPVYLELPFGSPAAQEVEVWTAAMR